MEGIIQRSSSQALDPSNNNGVKKSTTVKPPLLPKPQISKLDTKFKAVKKNQVSPSFIAKQNEFETANKSVSNVSVSQTFSPIANGRKPPAISPKPQLPPKSSPSKPETPVGRPDVSEKPIFIPQKSASADNTPLRPPRSPNKNFKKDQFDVYEGSLDSSSLPDGVILSRQKSASLCRNEGLNWTIKDLIDSSDQLTEFCKQVENCSKHSHILKTGMPSPVTPVRWKQKYLNDLDFPANGRARSEEVEVVDVSGVDVPKFMNGFGGDSLQQLFNKSGKSEGCAAYCINKSAQNQSQYRTFRSLSQNSASVNNGASNYNCHHTISRSASVEKTPGVLEDGTGNKRKQNVNSSCEQPKSFLHSYVNTSNLTKESVESDEKVKDKNVNVQSFLYKSRDLSVLRLKRTSGQDKSDSPQAGNNNSVNEGACVTGVDDSRQDKSRVGKTDDLKKSDKQMRQESSDGVPFSKRFPWFGSFGKGNKKDAKKGRCVSQVYSPSTEVEDAVGLGEKSRAKSLPDIKPTRVSSDEAVASRDKETSTKPEIIRVDNEYPHSDSDDDKDSLNQVEMTSEKDSKTLAYLKARELMTSEEVFTDVLRLLNVDFRNYVQLRNFEGKNSCIPSGEINKILNHLSQLQILNEDILEDLKKRIENWDKNPKIADVIVKKGAFLKMYTTYIQNFESQTNYLDECVVKYPKFGKIVKEFEASDRCKKLTLKHYMLKPVQRIPQYRLLLNDYLKHLDESSADYEDTLAALKIVCEVVDHANRNLAQGDKEGRLMHFQSLLSDYELIKPGREFVKDGPLEKICRKSVKDRYFILLNDCLLHTTYSKGYLKVHQELPLSGMKICCNDDHKYPTSFTVLSITKSFILCAKNESECKEWVDTLRKTIEEHIKRQRTFLNAKIDEVDSSFKLGKEAPVWVQDSKVTMCQTCTAEFTALFRRHHCRGCGKVVCRNCGSNQAPLQYRNFKPDRVCDQCFELLLKDYEQSENSICEILKEVYSLNEENAQNEYLSVKAKFIKYTPANWKKPKYVPPRLKEVPANDSQSVISGWLYRKSRKSWKLFWYVLKDHVLYVYKASEDVLALTTIPVLGYDVERASENYEDVDKKLIFSLVHPRQTPITFRAESSESAERWFDALSTATNFDELAI